MVINENWISSFPVGNMLILRFFAFFWAAFTPPPLSSLSSFGFATATGCLLAVRLLGFVLVRAVSFISLASRPVFCLLGCSITSISSSSSEVAFLLPFFRVARTWSSSGCVALALPFFFSLGSDISSISLSPSCDISASGLGGLPPVDLRAVLLRGRDSVPFECRTAVWAICADDECLAEEWTLRRGDASISTGSSSRGIPSSRGGVEALWFCFCSFVSYMK